MGFKGARALKGPLSLGGLEGWGWGGCGFLGREGSGSKHQ